MNYPNMIDLDRNPQNVWFMSDLHYGHENILKLAKDRPFADVAEMDAFLLETVRNTLNKDDILFDLGDLFWKTEIAEMRGFCKFLPRKTIKIMGNHDKEHLYTPGGILRNFFSLVADLIDLRIRYRGEDIRITLSHYPLLEWNHKFDGAINIHGHCHGNIDDAANSDPMELRIDVGVDGALAKEKGTFILSLDDVLEAVRRKTGGLEFSVWGEQNLKQYLNLPDGAGAGNED